MCIPNGQWSRTRKAGDNGLWVKNLLAGARIASGLFVPQARYGGLVVPTCWSRTHLRSPFHLAEMDANRGVDIDDEEDLRLAELLVLGLRRATGAHRLRCLREKVPLEPMTDSRQNKKMICTIPARGGSKRLRRKNVRDLAGKPMIAYSIGAALQSGLFEQVYVCTEDEEIGERQRSSERPCRSSCQKSYGEICRVAYPVPVCRAPTAITRKYRLAAVFAAQLSAAQRAGYTRCGREI